MNIRPFAIADQDAVIQIWQACGLVTSWNDPEKDIARKVKVNPELFLVAERDGLVIGTIMGGYDGHRGWINYLAVTPDAQGHKIGEQLIKITEQKLLALGCPKVNLQIRSTNTQMIEYYRKLGYLEDHAVGMGKRLIPDNNLNP
ncbi:MAG: GNAT family acetyltransferase [Reinekea sp.]|jgi:ribosomal protein S18 acetylase RimI-like enzyme